MLTVYGLKCSYFTGKLEGYLRYKEIPFEYRSIRSQQFERELPKLVGAMQMPAAQASDGRWMTDTSPMIDWLETQHPEPSILPADPTLAFLCRLIEDYADEWLWRPAMHYRWSYPESAKLLRRQIVDEMATDVSYPKALIRLMVEKRQHRNFVRDHGVTPANRTHVEQGYLRPLAILREVFRARPYLFGSRPTLADIGLFGPFFRHFAMDPTPGRIMRETAPEVMEWVYRLWNAKASALPDDLLTEFPKDLSPVLREIGETHLPNLCANAAAYAAGAKTFSVQIQGAAYQDVFVSRYRVWCLEKLQQRFAALNPDAHRKTASLLEEHGCLEPLTRISVESGHDLAGEAPFGNRSLPVQPEIRSPDPFRRAAKA